VSPKLNSFIRGPHSRGIPLSPAPPSICLDRQLFPPLHCVRWLGYWFTPNLASSAHFSKRLRLAQGAFATVKGLSLPGSSLSPHLAYRLAISRSSPPSCMVPTLGSPHGNANKDGRLLAQSPTLGFTLLQINPNTCPSSGSLYSCSVGHCPAQATYRWPQTTLRPPHSQPCSWPSLPNLPLPT